MKIPPTLVEWMHLVTNNFPSIEQHMSLGGTYIEFNKTSHMGTMCILCPNQYFQNLMIHHFHCLLP